jgi:uncharacterized protein (DUF433 family)
MLYKISGGGIKMQRIEFGKYIVADSNICHGALTFKGTRIFVQDVIEMVAVGMDWDAIIAEWDNVINHEAIAEAVRLAGKALVEEAQRRIAA